MTRPVERHTTTTLDSSALVATDRPARYGKQLTAHMSRKVTTTWGDDGHGTIEFDGASAVLDCVDGGLRITLTAPADLLDRFEDVVGRHLVRFATRDVLVASWQRSDGTPGTEQRTPPTDAAGS